MSLVSYINKYCPNGVSHSHCNGYNMGLKSKKKCALCTNNKIRKNFSRICSKYYEIKTYFFDEEQIKAIRKSLTNSEKFYLPTEIQDVIIKFGTYNENIKIPILLNDSGIGHLMTCKQCSTSFIKWINNESCLDHMIPRICNDNEKLIKMDIEIK